MYAAIVDGWVTCIDVIAVRQLVVALSPALRHGRGRRGAPVCPLPVGRRQQLHLRSSLVHQLRQVGCARLGQQRAVRLLVVRFLIHRVHIGIEGVVLCMGFWVFRCVVQDTGMMAFILAKEMVRVHGVHVSVSVSVSVC